MHSESRPMDIASVRILRMALGTALSLWFSQARGMADVFHRRRFHDVYSCGADSRTESDERH